MQRYSLAHFDRSGAFCQSDTRYSDIRTVEIYELVRLTEFPDITTGEICHYTIANNFVTYLYIAFYKRNSIITYLIQTGTLVELKFSIIF